MLEIELQQARKVCYLAHIYSIGGKSDLGGKKKKQQRKKPYMYDGFDLSGFQIKSNFTDFLKIPPLASKDTWEQSEQKESLSDVIVLLTYSLRIKHQRGDKMAGK